MVTPCYAERGQQTTTVTKYTHIRIASTAAAAAAAAESLWVHTSLSPDVMQVALAYSGVCIYTYDTSFFVLPLL